MSRAGAPANGGGDETLRAARARALKWLAARDHSEVELRQKLRRAGCDEPAAEAVVAWLKGLGYLSDARFAQAWVASRLRHKPMGRLRLAQELRAKGVDPRAAEEALTGLDLETETELAIALARRRYGAARGSDEAVVRRARGYLVRRGFRSEAIQSAIRQVLGAADPLD